MLKILDNLLQKIKQIIHQYIVYYLGKGCIFHFEVQLDQNNLIWSPYIVRGTSSIFEWGGLMSGGAYDID